MIFSHKRGTIQPEVFVAAFETARSTQGRGYFPGDKKGNRCTLEILWLSAKHPIAKKPLSNLLPPTHTLYLGCLRDNSLFLNPYLSTCRFSIPSPLPVAFLVMCLLNSQNLKKTLAPMFYILKIIFQLK